MEEKQYGGLQTEASGSCRASIEDSCCSLHGGVLSWDNEEEVAVGLMSERLVCGGREVEGGNQ